MAALSKVVQEIESVAGDVLDSLPSIGQIITKIDPHLAAVDKIVELAPRFEAVVQELEAMTGITPPAKKPLPEPPAPTAAAAVGEAKPAPGAGPIQISAPGVESKPEPQVEAGTSESASSSEAPAEQNVTIEVTPEQAAALGKTPIQITAPENAA